MKTHLKISPIFDKYNLKYVISKDQYDGITNMIADYKSTDENKQMFFKCRYCNGINLENTIDIKDYHKMGIDKTEQIIGKGKGQKKKPFNSMEIIL